MAIHETAVTPELINAFNTVVQLDSKEEQNSGKRDYTRIELRFKAAVCKHQHVDVQNSGIYNLPAECFVLPDKINSVSSGQDRAARVRACMCASCSWSGANFCVHIERSSSKLHFL
ncbi:hypothetical protein J6590_032447 [Homalodisca vitripennis]|nr:hypothetical protein J6590_032447 [Homalodisca vitripennis]